MDKFPAGTDILDVFKPDNWARFLADEAKCLTAPSVTLSSILQQYGRDIVIQLVRNQFVGLFNLTSAREYNVKGVGMAADLFVATYGHQLTPYGLMLYFAKYPTAYKESYREFDSQDVLRQCPKFLTWWQAHQQEQPEPQQTAATGISLDAMVRVWVGEGRTNEDFRLNSGLYRCGKITDAMIAQARREVEQGIF